MSNPCIWDKKVTTNLPFGHYCDCFWPCVPSEEFAGSQWEPVDKSSQILEGNSATISDNLVTADDSVDDNKSECIDTPLQGAWYPIFIEGIDERLSRYNLSSRNSHFSFQRSISNTYLRVVFLGYNHRTLVPIEYLRPLSPPFFDLVMEHKRGMEVLSHSKSTLLPWISEMVPGLGECGHSCSFCSNCNQCNKYSIIHHVDQPVNISSKWWENRYSLFSRYDDGIAMGVAKISDDVGVGKDSQPHFDCEEDWSSVTIDDLGDQEAWFSATPENLARSSALSLLDTVIARRMRSYVGLNENLDANSSASSTGVKSTPRSAYTVVLDLFGGLGADAIALSQVFLSPDGISPGLSNTSEDVSNFTSDSVVFTVESSLTRCLSIMHNAVVYGISVGNRYDLDAFLQLNSERDSEHSFDISSLKGRLFVVHADVITLIQALVSNNEVVPSEDNISGSEEPSIYRDYLDSSRGNTSSCSNGCDCFSHDTSSLCCVGSTQVMEVLRLLVGEWKPVTTTSSLSFNKTWVPRQFVSIVCNLSPPWGLKYQEMSKLEMGNTVVNDYQKSAMTSRSKKRDVKGRLIQPFLHMSAFRHMFVESIPIYKPTYDQSHFSVGDISATERISVGKLLNSVVKFLFHQRIFEQGCQDSSRFDTLSPSAICAFLPKYCDMQELRKSIQNVVSSNTIGDKHENNTFISSNISEKVLNEGVASFFKLSDVVDNVVSTKNYSFFSNLDAEKPLYHKILIF